MNRNKDTIKGKGRRMAHFLALLSSISTLFILICAGIPVSSTVISADAEVMNLVPEINPPIFDGMISTDWDQALHLNGTFYIPNRYDLNTFDEIRWELALGHDDEWLYIGARIIDPGLNPWSDEDSTYPDVFTIYFNMGNRDLQFPEDGKPIWFFLSKNSQGEWGGMNIFVGDIYYDSLITNSSYHPLYMGPDYYQGRCYTGNYHWWYDYYLLNGQAATDKGDCFDPGDGIWASSDNGDEIVEFSVPLRSEDQYDGFNLDHKSIYNFGICLEYARQSEHAGFLLDQWPGDGWSPGTCENGELFYPLTIDLSVGGNSQPWANFSYSPADPVSYETVEFHDESYDADGCIVTYLWDFGDGHSSTEKEPSFTFQEPGYHEVRLTVTDDGGLSDTIVKNVFIGSSPPIANFTFTPSSPKVGETVNFIDLSEDDVGVVEWRWFFGEGGQSEEMNPSYTFQKAGIYNVTLYVTDENGLKSSKMVTIKVTDQPDEHTMFLPFCLLILMIGIALFLGAAFSWKKKTRSKHDARSGKDNAEGLQESRWKWK